MKNHEAINFVLLVRDIIVMNAILKVDGFGEKGIKHSLIILHLKVENKE